jgi:3-hydroxymyristoyl/3-hydroxydecanoyl-(acyl carrier protein) dehydratase
MNPEPLFTLEEILPILPHRSPFLFVDRVMALDPFKSILAERTLRLEEPQFRGHFPDRPIMPGVLVAEALAQTSGLLLGLSEKVTNGSAPLRPKTFFLATTAIKYTRPALPGDVLRLRATSDQRFSGLYRFQVEASVGEERIASGSLTLALVEGEGPAPRAAVGDNADGA